LRRVALADVAREKGRFVGAGHEFLPYVAAVIGAFFAPAP
jgi:hypothetical protein